VHITNVSELITKQASLHPQKKSITEPSYSNGIYHYTSYSFSELENQINRICNKLTKLGVKKGDKVLFFVKPNLDFCAITFALFRMGAITVFIDPGMKKKYFFECIRELRPDAIIGIPSVHILRKIFFWIFKDIRIGITTSKRCGLFTPSLYTDLELEATNFDTFKPAVKDLAAILYTSGGTGKPKGVEYTHDIFINQTRMLKEEFNLTHEDIDIPGFPLFSFFTLAMGMNSVIPDMDFSNPAKCDPKKLYQNITDSKATFVAGSPAIWERLAIYCHNNKLKLPSVKYLVMFGAPVRNQIHEYFSASLPNGTSYTPYGATECLPVSNISGSYIVNNTASKSEAGAGTCVGKPFTGVSVKIIEQTDEVLKSLQESKELTPGEIGEIIINSPNVTKAYYKMPKETSEAKIYEGDTVWHRMGDVGYLDNEGHLWFCGRKKHVIEAGGVKYYPIPVEQIINQHPDINKSALVIHAITKIPSVVVETDKKFDEHLVTSLRDYVSKNEKTSFIKRFYYKDKFPVDVRHNIKIDRIALSKEISERL